MSDIELPVTSISKDGKIKIKMISLDHYHIESYWDIDGLNEVLCKEQPKLLKILLGIQ